MNIIRKEVSCLLALLILVGIMTSCDGETRKKSGGEYCFSAQGVTFSVGEDCDRVTAMLGEANSHSSAASCADPGLDELYVYNGFRIYAHRAEDRSRITAIELTNDLFATAEGVGIGDSAEHVTEIYGEGEPFSGGVEYAGENCRLRFYIKEGKISGIRYC